MTGTILKSKKGERKMQETNTKSLKKQLAAAIAMLLVAVVALGTASYAWFVSNNKVTATTSTMVIFL